MSEILIIILVCILFMVKNMQIKPWLKTMALVISKIYAHSKPTSDLRVEIPTIITMYVPLSNTVSI